MSITRVRSGVVAAALLLVATAGGAGAMPDSPEETIDRIKDRVSRGQDRAEAARRHAELAAARAEAAARRAEAGQGAAAERAVEAVANREVTQAARDPALRAGEDVTGLRNRWPAPTRALAASHAQAAQDRVLAYPDRLEMTDVGPAVRGQIVAIDPDPAVLAAAREAGFVVVAEEMIEGLDMRSVTLRTPRGMSVQHSLGQLGRMAPGTEFVANHLHSRSGAVAAAGASAQSAATIPAQNGRVGAPAIGIIDGGVARHASLAGPLEQRGFTAGAPRPDAHATAVASLAVGRGVVRGAAPGAPLLVADVYGNDPAGGNALVLAQALGWMALRRVPVVVVSLVGPANRLVARAVAQAQARGVVLVAPVGNGGPAAPPAYPASYPGVVAVTGVDGRNRALIEAGRSLHLDYAAPGADMAAASLDGGLAAVRGTSFAAPLVAGRLFHAVVAGGAPLPRLNSEAVDLGAAGPDRLHGRGLLCGTCRTPMPKKSRAAGLNGARTR